MQKDNEIFSQITLTTFYHYQAQLDKVKWLHHNIKAVKSADCKGKDKSFPYSLPSVGHGADPGVQTVSPQVVCHYFPPDLQLPSQPQSITAPWLVPSYTAWWQRHIDVNNLPKSRAALPRVGFEPTTCWLQVQRSTHWATAPPQTVEYSFLFALVWEV